MAATTPIEIHELFTQYFRAGDLDALLSLYESNATFVPKDGPPVSGLAAIRDAFAAFLSLKPKFHLQLHRVYQAGNIALIFSDWTLKGTDPNGVVIENAGRTSDVVRQQPDGSWLFVIDNPNGGAAD